MPVFILKFFETTQIHLVSLKFYTGLSVTVHYNWISLDDENEPPVDSDLIKFDTEYVSEISRF